MEVKNVSIVPVEEVVLALSQKYPDISQVNLTKNCTTRGINYRNWMILACGSTAGICGDPTNMYSERWRTILGPFS